MGQNERVKTLQPTNSKTKTWAKLFVAFVQFKGYWSRAKRAQVASREAPQ